MSTLDRCPVTLRIVLRERASSGVAPRSVAI
jgi:hypothetical protein